MRWQGQSLITPVSPNGILDLEFAKTETRFIQLRMFWNPNDVSLNIYLDFLFIAAYAWFFISACNLIKQKTNWSKWPSIFSSIAIAAAFFDMCENFLMLLVLYGRFSPNVLHVVYYCAAIKFLLVASIILFILIAIPFAVRARKLNLFLKSEKFQTPAQA